MVSAMLAITASQFLKYKGNLKDNYYLLSHSTFSPVKPLAKL